MLKCKNNLPKMLTQKVSPMILITVRSVSYNTKKSFYQKTQKNFLLSYKKTINYPGIFPKNNILMDWHPSLNSDACRFRKTHKQRIRKSQKAAYIFRINKWGRFVTQIASRCVCPKMAINFCLVLKYVFFEKGNEFECFDEVSEDF